MSKLVPMFYASRSFGGGKGTIELYTNEDGNTVMFAIEDPSGRENIILSSEEVEFLYKKFGELLRK